MRYIAWKFLDIWLYTCEARMSELFEEEDDKIILEDDVEETDEIIPSSRQRPGSNARKRLESLLEEKRLRDELDDFLDY